MEKPKRQYTSKRRTAAAVQTKKNILQAADRLFRKNGWSGTTIAAIAGEASVSSETIYSVFSNKRSIIRDLIIGTVRRGEPDIPVVEQDRPREVFALRDAGARMDMFCRDIADVLSRVAPLMAIVRTAADTEEELAELYLSLQAGRRQNLLRFAQALQANGNLRDGLDVESATDILWRLASPELFELMSRVEKTDASAFAAWLAAMAKQLLLPQGASGT